jgi:hypothetical protein
MTTKDKLTEVLRLYAFTVTEIKDMQAFLNHDKINTQFYRRLFLRNVFSVIETRLYVNRQLVLIKQTIDGESISPKERLLLEEKKIISDATGVKKTVEGFQDFISSFKFSLKIFAKEFNSSPPDFSDSNFDKLVIYANRRNNITHPKNHQELEITNDETMGFNHMFFWVYKILDKSEEGFQKWLTETWSKL